jgi:hypothetical protein
MVIHKGIRREITAHPGPGRRAAKPAREPTPHDRRALHGILLVLGILAATLAVSIPSGKNIFIFGYIAAIVYVTNGPMWRHRPWQELGLKRGFLTDLRGVWYLVAVVAVLFQVLPPGFGIARLDGYYPELVQHVSARLPVTIGSQKGVAALAGLLAAMRSSRSWKSWSSASRSRRG